MYKENLIRNTKMYGIQEKYKHFKIYFRENK